MQKQDDARDGKFREFLVSITDQPKPVETVYFEYSYIFDKLNALERQSTADLSIRHDRNQGLTVWSKVLDSLQALGNAIDGMIQLKPLSPMTAMVASRGSRQPEDVQNKEFAHTKAIEGGSLHILIKEGPDKENVELHLWVTRGDGTRLDEFLLTIIDDENQQTFFTDKRVSIAYHNEEIGQGRYRIKVKGQNVQGSMIVDNR